MKVKDAHGLGKQLKRPQPSSFFRALTLVYNNVMRLVPFTWKYGLGMALRRNHAPYRFHQQMNLLGYEYVACNDRGYCFHRNDQACTANPKSRAA
jgi:hypothetical protein